MNKKEFKTKLEKLFVQFLSTNTNNGYRSISLTYDIYESYGEVCFFKGQKNDYLIFGPLEKHIKVKNKV